MSARISAHKGAIEVLASASSAHRASDTPTEPGARFAAALGALAANFRGAADHPSHGSDDASLADDQTGGNANADGSAAATGKTPAKGADATGDTGDATPVTTQPGLAEWFTGSGTWSAVGAPAPTGQRGPAKPSAAAVAGGIAAGAAAATIAAALVGSASQSSASASPAATAADGPKVAVLTAAQLAQPGLGAPGPATPASLAGQPHAAPIGAAPAGDPPARPSVAANGETAGMPTAPSPGDPTGPPAAHTPGAGAPDPALPTAAADLSVSAPTQAAATAVPTVQPDAATLAAAAPAVAAMVAPVASSGGGSGTRDFTDTGRDSQQAAAAFGGVAAASSTTATAGGVGAPSVGAGAGSGPALGGDAGATNVATQLSGQVLRLLANSGHEAMVRLNPPDLGEVTVRVAISGRDVSAWFGSPQPDVQQSISAGLGQLQTDLGNAGYSLNNAWVGADASGFGAGGQTPPQPAPIAAPAQATPVTPVAAAFSSNSGVSIYV